MSTPSREASWRAVGSLVLALVPALASAAAGTTLPAPVTVPALGQPVPDQATTAGELNVFPDGTGLPPGRGDVATGEALYEAQCRACHGPEGRGATAEELAGGERALDGEWPDKTVGRYWPYATTLFDFIRRSMPMTAPGSLTAEEVYAVVAYLLHLEGILPAEATLDAATLPAVRMPNRDGFLPIYPVPTPLP